MVEVFGHKYELYISPPDYLIEYHLGEDAQVSSLYLSPMITRSSLTSGYIDYRTIDPLAVKITNPIQMVANIKYGQSTSSGGDNQCEIKLYNLSDDTLSRIKDKSTVLLNAGYENEPAIKTVFIGNILNVSTTTESGSSVTTILCQEGRNVTDSVRVKVKIYRNTSMIEVLNLLINKFKENGIPLGAFTDVEQNLLLRVLPETYVKNSSLKDAMTEFCNMVGFVWFISNGKLFVQPREVERAVDVFRVEPETIIDKIKPATDSSNKSSVQTVTSKELGVKFTTFFNADIRPESIFQITYGKYQGFYKPTSIEIDLNWQDGPWQTTVTCNKAGSLSLNQNI